MADLDPAHVEAVADLVGEWLFRMHGIQSSCDHHAEATELLASTDPDVHAALLAALVRAGILSEERESATLRMFGGKVVMRKGASRFVTEWAEVSDDA